MTISSFENLYKWFQGNSRKGHAAPYWTLYGIAYGNKDAIVARNDRLEDTEESYRMLEESIKMVNNPSGQRFRVIQVDSPGGNNPVGQVHVQIYEQQMTTAPMTPFIGAPGYIAESEIQKIVGEERKKWEMEARIQSLEDQLENPGDPVEKWTGVFERIAQTPLGQVLVARFMGVPLPPITPTQVQGNDDPGDDDHEFYDNLQETAQLLGTDEYKLAAKLKKFAQTNPEMAKNLFSQL